MIVIAEKLTAFLLPLFLSASLVSCVVWPTEDHWAGKFEDGKVETFFEHPCGGRRHWNTIDGGSILFRPELVRFWDYKIYVQVDPETSLRRGLDRDSDLLGGREVTQENYLKRYIPGQKIYHEKFNPASLADLVIQNDNPIMPVILSEQ